MNSSRNGLINPNLNDHGIDRDDPSEVYRVNIERYITRLAEHVQVAGDYYHRGNIKVFPMQSSNDFWISRQIKSHNRG